MGFCGIVKTRRTGAEIRKPFFFSKMARARNIKPSFFLNEDLVELPFHTRLLFIGLWTIADRDGRLCDKVRQIKMSLFPGDDINIDEALTQLADAKFITRYVVKNERFIEVVNFTKHQNPHVKEGASTIPAPCKPRARTRRAVPLTDSLLLNPESPILNPETNTDSSADEIDAVDAHTLGYPLADLFKFFPRLTITPAQCGMIQAEVHDNPADREAWAETIKHYVGNHDPSTNSYMPQKVGNLLSVFKSKRKGLENRNGKPNGSEHANTKALREWGELADQSN